MPEMKNNPEPTGGWKQYRLAVRILILFPILMLGGVLILVLFSHRQRQAYQHHLVSPTSHEPYHLSLKVLPPLRPSPNQLRYQPENVPPRSTD
jgi:hypothetical protein